MTRMSQPGLDNPVDPGDEPDFQVSDTLLSQLNPAWLFRCRPGDFPADGPTGLCPGLFWLFLLPLATCLAFTTLWNEHGWSPGLLLVWLPAHAVWGLLGAADVTFRRQRPTPGQRAAFDRVAITWVGLVGHAVALVVGLPVGLALLVGWLVGA